MSLILENHSNPSVSILSLNRPDKRNALNIELMDALTQTIQKIDPKKRVLILQGEGPVFCAGLDLIEASDHTKSQQSSGALARLLQTLYTTPLVTIAAVHGAAIAGGAGLMAACDYVLADPKTLFGFPEVRRGLAAAQITTYLKRQLKERDLRELLLFGELINAERAKEMGLINQTLDQHHFLPELMRLADLIVLGGPQAIASTKKLLQSTTLNEDVQNALKIHHNARTSPEAQEGIAAFLDHRSPKWAKRLHPLL